MIDRQPISRPTTAICLAWCCALVLLLAGCGKDQLETRYGRHRMTGFNGSINGTDVLAAMFEAAGHSVYFRRTLVTGDMVDADVVVWFPDDRAVPRREVIEWFDEWLSEYPDRTLVYVGRDYNAAPEYMQFLMEYRAKNPPGEGKSALPPVQHDRMISEARRKAADDRKQASAEEKQAQESQPEDTAKKADAKKKADSDKQDNAKKKDVTPSDKVAVESTSEESSLEESSLEEGESRKCDWFAYEEQPRVEIQSLAGPWAEGIDAAEAKLELRTQMLPEGSVEELLTSDGKFLAGIVRKRHWGDSQLILVANGSFLLNLPLVRHENRKLAWKLVEATGEPVEVVFLESGAGGPPIDPPYTDNSLWTLFTSWPLGTILLQLAVVGVIFCFARWPIFGRPKQPPADSTTDFAKHIVAVGRLLERTRPRDAEPTLPADSAAPLAGKVARDPRSVDPHLK